MDPSTSSSFDLQEPVAHHPCDNDVSDYPLTAMAQGPSTLYVPIVSPPTPAPSPRLSMSSRPNLHPESFFQGLTFDSAHNSRQEFASLSTAGPAARRQYLTSLLNECTPSELLFISTTIAPLLKRDFFKELPMELSLYILCFVDSPRTLTRASQVSRHWHTLLSDEWTWKRMCDFYYFDTDLCGMRHNADEDEDEPLVEMERFADYPLDPALRWLMAKNRKRQHQSTSKELLDESFSYRRYFKYSYKTSKLLRNCTLY
jgi:F-box and WD-40 domain protein CDC4